MQALNALAWRLRAVFRRSSARISSASIKHGKPCSRPGCTSAASKRWPMPQPCHASAAARANSAPGFRAVRTQRPSATACSRPSSQRVTMKATNQARPLSALRSGCSAARSAAARACRAWASAASGWAAARARRPGSTPVPAAPDVRLPTDAAWVEGLPQRHEKRAAASCGRVPARPGRFARSPAPVRRHVRPRRRRSVPRCWHGWP